jgi:hypothetical protein
MVFSAAYLLATGLAVLAKRLATKVLEVPREYQPSASASTAFVSATRLPLAFSVHTAIGSSLLVGSSFTDPRDWAERLLEPLRWF